MRNIETKTGKTLEEWIGIVQRDGPAEEKERLYWLKSEHGFGMNYAMWVAERASGKGSMTERYDPEGSVREMFASRQGLIPIYEKLLEIGLSIAPDVIACPCSTIVPLYRKHVFAQIKPTTKARIDLGLALKGVSTQDRLIDTGGATKGDRITHRIPIDSIQQIDKDVEHWLRVAYDKDA